MGRYCRLLAFRGVLAQHPQQASFALALVLTSIARSLSIYNHATYADSPAAGTGGTNAGTFAPHDEQNSAPGWSARRTRCRSAEAVKAVKPEAAVVAVAREPSAQPAPP